MSTIDQLIQSLHRERADRLLLVSGKQPVLAVNGGSESLGEEVDRVGLEGMVLLMGDDAETGQRQFRYDAPSGAVDVTVRVTERVIQVIVVPASAAVPEAPVAVGGAAPEDDDEETIAFDASAAVEPVSFDRGYAFGAEVGESPPENGSGADEATSYLDPSALPEDFGTAEAEPRISTNGSTLDGLPMLDDPPPTPAAREMPAAEAPAPEAPTREPEPPTQALETRPDAPAMERLFLKMVEHGCSDIHVSAGSAPLFRKDGRITDLGGEPLLSPRDSESLLLGITPDRYRKQFEERNDTDFAYEIPGVARFRCNLFRDRKGMGGVFRQIPTDIMTADDLGLDQQLLDLCALKKGLILVTGPTGSGKSTTLAALIDHINRSRQDHVITIEDPIEFVHENRECLINQREVGEHTQSFKVALRAALREDPDIVLVGELRDLETVEIALETAETGHLVFGTLHTNTAPGTVSRLIDQFPSGQQAQIRTMLADTLKAVIAQTLCRKTGGGRVAALEVLVVNNAVANLIREDKAYQIPSAMQTGRSQGMNTLNDALLDLVQRSVVEPQEAYWNAVDKSEFGTLLTRNGIEIPG